MEQKLTTLEVQVPYRGAGNIITNKPVSFDILQENSTYKAVPLLDTDERRVANLPPELSFYYTDGKASSTRGIKDGNLHVILDIAEALKAKHML
ncbi:MAG: hypothetical protein ICV53_17005 [Flavisolibacter sp.]|nr:hypothetical protein [Flavisolibacter sp.]